MNSQPEIVVKTHSLHRPLSSPEFFGSVLKNSGRTTSSRPTKRFSNWQRSILIVGLICFILGSYFTYVGFRTIKLSNAQAASFRQSADQVASSSLTGSSSTDSVSTVKISASTIAAYSVAANLPRYLIIPKLNVDARVFSVGVEPNGEIGTPSDIYDTAWYSGSAKPGQPGAMLIDGHVSSWTTKGVFYNLKTLVAGDTFQVERGGGTIYTYKVVRSQLYPANNVDMKAALEPVVADQPGLNLISCAGDVIKGTSEFSERIVVFSEQL